MTWRCDTHIHVVGEAGTYPQDPTRSYTAMPASVRELQRLAKSRNISRFVVVQPSFYGTDNTVLLEALAMLGEHGRGVAVVHAALETPASLAAMHMRGVRGLRVNLYSGSTSRSQGEIQRLLTTSADLAASMNWHIEVIAPLDILVAAGEMLAGLPSTIVLDHYGVHHGYRPESAKGQALLDLVALPHIWMKLSAPYRSSEDPLLTAPDADWLRATLEKAGERCVWGSDWPFTPVHKKLPDNTTERPYRALSYERLFDDFAAGVSDPDLLDRILIENPVHLYGFDA